MIKILLFFGLLAVSTSAVTCDELYAKGVALYANGDYTGALQSWQSCENTGMRNAALFHAMGNAWFRQGKIGWAITYYESAHRLDPMDADIAHNLIHARSLTRDKVANSPDDNPVLRALFSVHHMLSPNQQTWVLIGMAWVIGLCLALWPWIRLEWRTILLSIMLTASMLAGLGVLSLGYKVWLAESQQTAVVVERTADVLSGPGNSFKVLNELNEGTVFEVTGMSNEWYAVRIDDQVRGFIHRSQMSLLR